MGVSAKRVPILLLYQGKSPLFERFLSRECVQHVADLRRFPPIQELSNLRVSRTQSEPLTTDIRLKCNSQKRKARRIEPGTKEHDDRVVMILGNAQTGTSRSHAVVRRQALLVHGKPQALTIGVRIVELLVSEHEF